MALCSYVYIYILLISDNYCVFVISKESELHHSIGNLIDGAHLDPKNDRDYLGRHLRFNFRRHHFSFFPFAVSKVYGQ